VAEALLCAGGRSQRAGNGRCQARLAVWASSWILQDVEDETSGKSTTSTEYMRKETIQPGSVIQSFLSAGSLCTIGACPARLLRFPDDEEDFMGSYFTVLHRLVLEIYELETGTGSSTREIPGYADGDILPHAVVVPCVKDGNTEQGEMRFRADIKRAASILPLSRSTRAVLCITACTSEKVKVSN
jgi:hypothetical protein